MAYKVNKSKFLRTLMILCVLIIGVAAFLGAHSGRKSGQGTQQAMEEDGDMQVPYEGNTQVKTQPDALKGVKIVIDAGHGGFDVGTSGITTKVKEEEINLAIAQKLEKELADIGAEIVMTRKDNNAIGPTKDEDMKNRRKIIEESGEDLVVSIHQNRYADENVTGPQVFYLPGSTLGRAFAETLQSTLNEQLEPKTPRTAASADYYILRSGSAPCVIVECGFLSSPEEEKLLMEDGYQQKVAQALRDGVVAYWSSQKNQEGPMISIDPQPE